MANAKHKLITFSYTLDPAPFGRATLGTVLVLIEDSDLGTDPESAGTGERTVTYASKAEIDNAVTNAHMTTEQGELGKAVFDQIPTPEKVRYGDIDATATAETHANGYNAVKAETDDFFFVTSATGTSPLTRAAADQEVLVAAGSSDLKFFMLQSSEADVLAGTHLGAGNSHADLSTVENAAIVYHPDDEEPLAEAYAAARGTFDPDNKSAGWQGVVRGVNAYADGSVSSSERDTMKNADVNVMLTWGSQDNYVSPGVNLQGRQIKNMVSVFWYVIRVTEDLIDAKLSLDAEGELIPVSDEGQAIVRAVLEKRYDLGVAGGHFKADQLVLTFPDPIPDADVDDAVIKTENWRITTLQNAEEFDLTVSFTRDDVVVDATEA